MHLKRHLAKLCWDPTYQPFGQTSHQRALCVLTNDLEPFPYKADNLTHADLNEQLINPITSLVRNSGWAGEHMVS